MKKIILTVAFIATGMIASAQVGIGNEDPKTTLHVTGANNGAALTAADGVTVPRVSTDMRDSGTAVSGVELGQLVYSTNVDSIGFWYWAGATEKWNPLVAAAAAPAFTVKLNQAASAGYDWSTYFNFFDFSSGTQLTLPLPNNALYVGKLIYLRNRTGGTLGFTGTTGIGTPLGFAAFSAGSVTVYSDGTNWHLLSGRP